MHFPKFTLLLNKFREQWGQAVMEAILFTHFEFSSCFFNYKKNKIRALLLSRRKALKRASETFNIVELFMYLFRLIAGHMPKPVKPFCRDALQYLLRKGY